MKKGILAIVLSVLAGAGYAQTPEKKSLALITKLTGTWCGPCGTWGWEVANNLIAATENGKALYMGAFVGVTANGNKKFKNATADVFNIAFATPEYGGVPDFSVNGIGRMPKTLSVSGATDTCMAVVNAFNATTPLASPANKMSISGNTVNVTAKAQFWSAGNGEYYLAAYLIEDGALNLQYGQNGTVPHHSVLRGTMSPGKHWGEQIANGAVTANQTFSKTFTFTVTDAEWDKTKFKVYTVIWKKNGSKYEFVNASKNEPGGTAIQNIAGVEEISVFPNPAARFATLSIKATAAQAFDIQVSDMSGRLVYRKDNNKLSAGDNNFTLPLEGLNAGMYNVTILSKSAGITRRLAVTK